MRPSVGLGITIMWIPLAFLFDGMTALVLPVKLGTRTDAGMSIGLISFVGLAAAVAIQPLFGMLSDRLRDRVDRQAMIAIATVPAIAGVWLLVGDVDVMTLALGYLVIQVAASAIQASQQTLIPEHVAADSVGRAAGLKAAFDIGGAFLAFLTLGAVLESDGLASAAGLTTALLIGAIVLLRILVPSTGDRGTRQRVRRPGGMPPGFARLIVVRFLYLVGIFAIGRFLLLLVADRLGIDVTTAAGETGWLLALFTLTTAGVALGFGRYADRIDRDRGMAVGTGLSVVGILLFLSPLGLPGLLAAGIVMSIGTAVFVTANWAALTGLAPAPDAGRLMGLANIGTGGAAAAAGLIGPIIDAAGFAIAIVIAAAFTAAAWLPLVRIAEVLPTEPAA